MCCFGLDLFIVNKVLDIDRQSTRHFDNYININVAMKYRKNKKVYRFEDLRNDKEFREKYSDSFLYTRSYPYTFFCWFSYKDNVFFIKRPQYLSDNTLVYCVVIKTDTIKAAKKICSNLTDKELKRMFNKCNSVLLK